MHFLLEKVDFQPAMLVYWRVYGVVQDLEKNNYIGYSNGDDGRVWTSTVFEHQAPRGFGDTPIFHFHDYGRKGK